MKIITVADDNFKEMLSISSRWNRKLGYTVETFPVPPEFKGYAFGDVPERIRGKIPYKPNIIRSALLNYDGPIVWMDADAFAIQPFDEIWQNDFDIGVTLRRAVERKAVKPEWMNHYGYINAGVMFFRPTVATIQFVDAWIKKVKTVESMSDQEALNLMLLEKNDLNCRGQSFTVGNAVVKVFSTDDYNWYYWPEEIRSNVKIVHMKTDKRKIALEWLLSFVCL